METALNFTQQSDGRYKASYTSAGDTAVQLDRVADGTVNVYANIPGMPAVALWGTYFGKRGSLFRVCVPAGMVVTIESDTAVTTGKTWTEDEA